MEELQKKYEAAVQLLANQLDTIITLTVRLQAAETKIAALQKPAESEK